LFTGGRKKKPIISNGWEGTAKERQSEKRKTVRLLVGKYKVGGETNFWSVEGQEVTTQLQQSS